MPSFSEHISQYSRNACSNGPLVKHDRSMCFSLAYYKKSIQIGVKQTTDTHRRRPQQMRKFGEMKRWRDSK